MARDTRAVVWRAACRPGASDSAEQFWRGSNDRIPRLSVQLQRNVNALPLQHSRDNKTAIELFVADVRALAFQSRLIDVVRIGSRFSSGTGGH